MLNISPMQIAAQKPALVQPPVIPVALLQSGKTLSTQPAANIQNFVMETLANREKSYSRNDSNASFHSTVSVFRDYDSDDSDAESGNISTRRGQEGTVSIQRDRVVKNLHPKVLRYEPDSVRISVSMWNNVYHRMGLNELATAKIINSKCYEMPRIYGKTIAEKAAIENRNAKSMCKEVRDIFLEQGIDHTDLYHEEGIYNPGNAIYSDHYNRYLPIDMEGIELL